MTKYARMRARRVSLQPTSMTTPRPCADDWYRAFDLFERDDSQPTGGRGDRQNEGGRASVKPNDANGDMQTIFVKIIINEKLNEIL